MADFLCCCPASQILARDKGPYVLLCCDMQDSNECSDQFKTCLTNTGEVLLLRVYVAQLPTNASVFLVLVILIEYQVMVGEVLIE